MSKLTQDEHAILYLESAMNCYRQHPNIKEAEVNKLVQVELHSMNLRQAKELVTKVKQEFQLFYNLDQIIIKDE